MHKFFGIAAVSFAIGIPHGLRSPCIKFMRLIESTCNYASSILCRILNRNDWKCHERFSAGCSDPFCLNPVKYHIPNNCETYPLVFNYSLSKPLPLQLHFYNPIQQVWYPLHSNRSLPLRYSLHYQRSLRLRIGIFFTSPLMPTFKRPPRPMKSH